MSHSYYQNFTSIEVVAPNLNVSFPSSQEAARHRPDPRHRDGVRGVREGAQAGRGEEGLGAAVRRGL